MKTFSAKPAEVEKKWVLIDAEGPRRRPSRLAHRHAAARQAQADLHAPCRLRRQRHRHQRREGGAHRPQARPDKVYYHHTGYPGRHQGAHREVRSSRAASPSASSRRPSSAWSRAARSAASSSATCASTRAPSIRMRPSSPRRSTSRALNRQEHEERLIMAETLQSARRPRRRRRGRSPPRRPRHVQKLDAQGRAYATGKRKNAIARVWIKPGTGKITVNDRELDVYFARPVLRMILQQPLVVANRVEPVRRHRHGRRRRPLRPGRRGAPRPLQGADLLRAGAARRRSRRAAS